MDGKLFVWVSKMPALQSGFKIEVNVKDDGNISDLEKICMVTMMSR